MKTVKLSLVSSGGSWLMSGRAKKRLTEGETRRLLMALPILTLVRRRAPDSVYALAKQIRADVSNVRKAVMLLADLGLIELSEVNVGNRRRLAPRVPFETITVGFINPGRPRSSRRNLQRRHMAE